MATKFLDTPSCVKTYYDRPETEFCATRLGYHDFKSLALSKTPRIQKMYTIHYVVSGKGYLHYHNKTYTIGAGDIFSLPPNDLFAYYPDDNDPWDYIFFEFDGSLAPQYIKQIGFSKSVPVKYCNNTGKVIASFTEIFEKHKNNLPVSHFEVTSLIYLLFHSASDRQSPALSSQHMDIVQEAKALIQSEFFNTDLTVKSISQQLHFSHSRLCRLFKEKTGMTMIGYLNESRMKYAEELLRNTNLKATQIAYMSGFNEYTYFLMQFKKRNKMTTLQYRAKYQ